MVDNNDISLMNVHPLNPTNQVTKANYLIEGNYNMSLPESKIMEAVLSMLDENEEKMNYIEIDTKELCNFVKVNLRELKEFTLDMVKKAVVFTGRDEDGTEKLIQTTWLDSAVYYPAKGIVRLRVSEELAPYLLGLRHRKLPYTRFAVDELISVTYYTKRIYELAMQYKKIGKRPEMTIQEFRQKLGIDDNKYALFAHLKSRVIDPSIKSIAGNEKMPYLVSYELIRSGRAYKSIIFYTKKKTVYMDSLSDNSTETITTAKDIQKMEIEKVREYLRGFGFDEAVQNGYDEGQLRFIADLLYKKINASVLKKFLSEKGFDYVKKNNDIALQRMANGGKSYGAILFSALKGDYAGEAEEQRKRQAQMQSNGKTKTAEEIKELIKRNEEAYAQQDKEKFSDEVTIINDIEITFLNRSIARKGDCSEPAAHRIYLKHKKSTVPKIREAIKLLEAGKEIPVNFFK
ncbi:Initiator Replication protein [Selenomonas ruminantium]|uniref:Initiator Replication protein n=1 Tax=Selenomonas ruminantium TaxID=971 RepID=A0A1I3H8W3_SELRU|nr:replication initiation protein [Selenomonas ruminantium]SFI32144.1 Initiator Replication protein [Selenomonas ruminantium]